jgi:hypothetical protein
VLLFSLTPQLQRIAGSIIIRRIDPRAAGSNRYAVIRHHLFFPLAIVRVFEGLLKNALRFFQGILQVDTLSQHTMEQVAGFLEAADRVMYGKVPHGQPGLK